MKQIITTLTLLLYIFTAMAQVSITGKVTDEQQAPVKAATALLLQHKDSLLLSSALTDDKGGYQFTNILPGKYIISISAIGYTMAMVPAEVDAAALFINNIQLKPAATTMAGVVVVSKKPYLEQRPDKLLVNVENSATAAGSNALEILKKVPGVIIRNDKVSISGKSNVLIMIEGRSSQYTDINQVLKDIPAANISKIEVISNPGAKYDAAGGAVINIILKRNTAKGTNGAVTVSGGAGLYDNRKEGFNRNFYRYSPGISFNHRKGRMNLFGNYSYNHRNWFEFNEFDRVVQTERYFQTNLFYYRVNSHNYRLGLDFYADKKNTLGFLVSGFNRDGGSNMTNKTNQTLVASGQDISNFQTLNSIVLQRNNYAANINWKHVFDSSGKQLNADADYSSFGLKNNSNIINNAAGINKSSSNQLVNNPVKFGVLKIDYTNPFKKAATLEAGVKLAYASIDNFLTFSQNGVRDTARSTEFLYTENINAAYINYSQTVKKWQLTGGLRTEQTVAKGKSYNQSVLSRNYWQLFPSLFISRELTTHFAATAQYSRRVDRPSYQQQNPFVLFLDSLTFTRGNPTIKPQLTDAYKFSITYDKQPFFAVSYNKTTDVIFNDAPRQEGNKTFTTPENLARFENITFELNFPIQLGKKISGFAGNQAILNHYKANYLGGTYNGKKWNWLAYWQVDYKPANSWNIEVSGYYITNFLSEFFTLQQQGALNIAVQKTILDKRGKFTLSVNDVLFSEKTRGRILYQDINVKFRQWEDTRNVRLSFTCSLGNQKIKAVRSRKAASDEESNRVKTK